jgi:hypothetical protein
MITDMSKERRIILTEVWDRWVNLSNEDFDTWLHTQMNSDSAKLQQHSVMQAEESDGVSGATVASGAVGANCWPERGRQAASGLDGAAWICGHQGRTACGSANST